MTYVLAGLTTVGQGSMELTFPLNLHHLKSSLPLIGTAVAFIGVGQLLSRLPGGHWYRPDSARWLNSAFLASHGLTTIGLALSPLWAVQASLAGLHGIAFGLVTTFQLAMLIDTRQRTGSRAGTIAWYTAAISIGYAAGSPLGAAAIDRFGYGGAFWISGAVSLIAAALSLLATPPHHHADIARPAVKGGWRGLVGGLARLPASIWLAALLALYLNFITDSVASFFPIYAVAIGISLGLVGLLRALNSLVGAGIRILAAAIFRVFHPEPTNHACVIGMAGAAFAISLVTGPIPLIAAFFILGASRGLIRVTSATFVADERSRLGRDLGLASGVYNAGLDAGAMIAPPVTGLIAATAGIPASFRVVSVALPLLYYIAWLLVQTRQRSELTQAERLDA